MARSSPSDEDGPSTIGERIKHAGLTGLALIIPLVVTILVLTFVWGFIASLVNPLSMALGEAFGLTSQTEQYVLLGSTTVLLAVLVVVMGLIADVTSRTGLEDAFDHAIGSIPGIGGIYSTFNEMSELLLDSDTQSFQEVVLVEYPNEDTFCVAFLTSDTPQFLRETVDKDEMITVFMPMGPNPFMGGFILHVSGERVHDVDMTVEEGIQSIVTSGAALDEHEDAGTDDGQTGDPESGHGYEAIAEEDSTGDGRTAEGS